VTRALAALLLGLALLVPVAAEAQAPANDALSAFAFDPHPGNPLPIATVLRDESGEAVTLARFFTGEPVVLVLDYLRCKTLCGLTLGNVIGALDGLPLAPGRDFQFLAISIDPRDTPADLTAAKAKYLTDRHPDAERGIHFLAGSADAVKQIARSVGFPYRYDPDTDQFIHPAGFLVAAPDGRISRYVFGIGADPAELRTALEDAARGRSVGPLTRLLLLCHIDAARAGRWTVPVLAIFTLADLAAMAAVLAVFVVIRRRRHG
jgi:protein SCO1